MIVKRKIQHITSGYGWRKGFKLFHKGIDLRSYNDTFTKKMPIVLPEKCKFIRATFQKKWAWTYVFKGIESDTTLKFTHMEEVEFYKDMVYNKDYELGYTTVTEYMKSKNLGDHLHFETLVYKLWANPIKYLELMEIPFE